MKCPFIAVLLLDDLFRLVVTAHFANMVRKFQLSALVAFDHARDRQLEMRAALVAASFGRFPEWYCHLSHLLRMARESGRSACGEFKRPAPSFRMGASVQR
jgi:hypothetical protein